MRKRFEYAGMAIVLMVYLAMTAVLLLERSGIRYDVTDFKVHLLSKEALPPAADDVSSAECLVLTDSSSEASAQAKEQFLQIFHDMKVHCHWLDVRTNTLPDLSGYRTAVFLLSDYDALGPWVLKLSDWVSLGGRAMLALPPQRTAAFMLIEQKLGIVDASYEYEQVDSVHFADSFMLGGNKTWPILDGYTSSLQVRLSDSARVYAWEDDEKAFPLIWGHDYGSGRFVVTNFGYMEKALRGIYAAAYSCLEEAFAYPVINGATFYLDDFPSPVPGGDGTYIRKDYKMTAAEFYVNVWWPDMLHLAHKHGVRYTGVVIENYDDKTDGDIVQQGDVAQFSYYGDILLKEGGEIGLHGYNHQPLSLDNVDYGEDLPYNTWKSHQAMRNAVNELTRFVSSLFPEMQSYVYVPPSNVLSPEGRALLGSCYPHIHTIASTYYPDGHVYNQEFAVAEDGIVEQPRTISGCIMDDYSLLAALSELNLHLVSNHFVHPDDMLDVDRGAALGWATMRDNLDRYMGWLYAACPPLRSLTGTELSGAVQRYCAANVTRQVQRGQMTLGIDNLIDEVYLLVRLEDKVNPVASGGTLQQLTDSLYLLRAESSNITITWSE